MTVWSSIDCEEVHETRQVSRNWKNGPRCSVVLQTAYANRFTLSADLFLHGFWPFTPAGEAPPRVQDISIEFLPTEYEQDEQAIEYKEVRLHVEYYYDDSAGDTQGGGAGSGRQLYTETIEPSMEARSFSEHDFIYFENGKPVPIPENNLPTVRLYKLSVVRTFYNWITVPATFITLQNTVNNAAVVMLGITFQPETLLFVPRSTQRSLSSQGTSGFTVQVAFVADPVGWNMFPVPDPVTGEVKPRELYVKSLDPAAAPKRYKPYKLADFSDWVF